MTGARIAGLILAFVGFFAGSSAGPAGDRNQGFVSTRGAQIIAADGSPLMLRGINLGNWLVPEGYMFGFHDATAPWQIRQVIKELVGPEANNAFWQRWTDTFITREDLHFIRHAGMNVVRVPFDYRLFTPEEHPGLWDEAGFRIIDRLIAQSASEGLYVLLDMHAAPCGQTGHNIDDSYGFPHLFTDVACVQRMVDVWRHIAARYRDVPTVIGYDILNEPLPEQEGNAPFTPMLMHVYRAAVAAIRAVDPNHIVVLSGINAAIDFSIFTEPHFDSKVVYTFHYYVKTPDDAAVERFRRFREEYDVPILMGEAGENSDAWVRAYREVLERHGINWIFWTYKKMASSSAMRRYAEPAHWRDIVAYQALAPLSLSDRRERRPTPESVREALDGLLNNIRFDMTTENRGFSGALSVLPASRSFPASRTP